MIFFRHYFKRTWFYLIVMPLRDLIIDQKIRTFGFKRFGFLN